MSALHEKDERWRDIKHPIWSNFYEISTYGRIRNKRNGHILTVSHGNRGYCNVTLKAAPLKWCGTVHRLVLNTFGPPQPSPKHECCHNDGDGSNNKISNLRWGTRKENIFDKIRHKTARRKFTPQQIHTIRELSKSGVNDFRISKKFNVKSWTISQIVRRMTYAEIN